LLKKALVDNRRIIIYRRTDRKVHDDRSQLISTNVIKTTGVIYINFIQIPIQIIYIKK